MPVSITHSALGTTSITYDAEGRRVVKTCPGRTTYYVNQYFEIENGVETKYILAGRCRIAKKVASAVYCYHPDHLGSARVMTDQNESEVHRSGYAPFGQARGQIGEAVSNYRFTVQELDPTTGLYNYDARLYDPVIGRFVSPDSIVPDWYDPQSLNRFAYAFNNPLNYIDPSGHEVADPYDTLNMIGKDANKYDLEKEAPGVALTTVGIATTVPALAAGAGAGAAAVAGIGLKKALTGQGARAFAAKGFKCFKGVAR